MDDDLDENILSSPVPVRYKLGILRKLEEEAARDGRTISQHLRIIAAEWLKVKHTERRTSKSPDFQILHSIVGTLNRSYSSLNQIAKGVNYNAPELAELPETNSKIRQTCDAILAYLSGGKVERKTEAEKPDRYTPPPSSQVDDDPDLAAALKHAREQMQKAFSEGKR